MTRLHVLHEERRTRAAIIRTTPIRPEWHPWAPRLTDLAILIHHARREETQ